MSDGQTNPTESEVSTPQLNMLDVMFGSEENTNPEVTSSEEVSDSTVEYEAEVEYEAVDDGEVTASEDDNEYEVFEEDSLPLSLLLSPPAPNA